MALTLYKEAKSSAGDMISCLNEGKGMKYCLVNTGAKALGRNKNAIMSAVDKAVVGKLRRVPTRPILVKEPIVKTTINTSYKPKFANTKGGVTITHTEYVKDVYPFTGFSSNGITINATSISLFPWLWSTASNFEKYKFNRLVMRYVPACSTSTDGRITLAYDRDSTDPLPLNKSELYSYQGTRDGPLWSTLSLNIPVDKLFRFCKSSNDLNNKLVDLGKVIVSASGPTTTTLVGELFVDYSVTLQTPEPLVSQTQQMTITSVSPLSVTYTGPEYGYVSSGNTLTFRVPGAYLVVWYSYGSGLTEGSYTTSDCTITYNTTLANTFGSGVMSRVIVWIAGSNATLYNNWGGGTISGQNVYMSRVSSTQF